MSEQHDIEHIKPCWHMKKLLSALVDGDLTGLIRRYARWHVAHCPRCQTALTALKTMSERLRALGASPHAPAAVAESAALSSDRWAALEAAWDDADRTA